MRFLISIILSTTLLMNLAYAQKSEGKVLGSVNGSKIYLKQVDEWAKNAVANGATDSQELRQSIANELVVREAILSDVKKSGLLNRDNNEFKTRVSQQNVLMDLWFADYFKSNPITEQDVKAEYDRQKELTKDGLNSQEYKLAQIVLASESDANDVLNKLNSGSSFETLAKEKSLDKSSGQGGGVLSWLLPDQVVPPIRDVLTSMSRGKVYSKPIKVGNSWHVLRLEDTRRYKLPSFDEVKQQIAQALINKRKQEAVEKLMKRTTVSK